MAGEKEKLHIRLHIYDTDMPVVIDRDDEFMYREAAKDINEAVNAYSEIFKGKKSDKEILYMALIDIAYNYEVEKSKMTLHLSPIFSLKSQTKSKKL